MPSYNPWIQYTMTRVFIGGYQRKHYFPYLWSILKCNRIHTFLFRKHTMFIVWLTTNAAKTGSEMTISSPGLGLVAMQSGARGINSPSPELCYSSLNGATHQCCWNHDANPSNPDQGWLGLRQRLGSAQVSDRGSTPSTCQSTHGPPCPHPILHPSLCSASPHPFLPPSTQVNWHYLHAAKPGCQCRETNAHPCADYPPLMLVQTHLTASLLQHWASTRDIENFGLQSKRCINHTTYH